MTRPLFASIFLLLLASFSFAQKEPDHPIDKALEACIEKDPSNAGTIECTGKAYQAWDKELNKNYGALMRKLKPAQKEALKAAQLEWIRHRDADFKLIDSIFDTIEGTMYISMRIESRTEPVKTRALLLKSFVDLVSDAAP
ncbi:MAG TPA: lysozyme inhibitor LprI family protein [Pyrinomonadaceae bacterium]|nr:lysozyme inhibitor LprI family protein [Pyrinomonadaceae bacterium]